MNIFSLVFVQGPVCIIGHCEWNIPVFSVITMSLGSEVSWPGVEFQLEYYESCDLEHIA